MSGTRMWLRVSGGSGGMVRILLISLSITGSASLSIALDWLMITGRAGVPDAPALVLLFNGTAIVQSLVGGVIEWRRPGHAIGRLLMLGGPLYAFLAFGWTASGTAAGGAMGGVLSWWVALLSYPGVALIAGWLPMLFPTGTLPGPRWRRPVIALIVISSASLAAWALRPGEVVAGGPSNPFGIAGWPTFLQPLADALGIELLAVILLAVVSLVVRYRRGDGVERLQIRWLLAALAITGAGFAGVIVESSIRAGEGLLVTIVVAYVGILAMPVAMGIAVLRYRLYDIDRIISRTIGWAVVTGLIGAVFAGLVIGLQVVLADLIEGEAIAVAASTLIALVLFQPVRARVRSVIDRRFDRARVDADRLAEAFAGRLRYETELATARSILVATAAHAVKPSSSAVWLRAGRP